MEKSSKIKILLFSIGMMIVAFYSVISYKNRENNPNHQLLEQVAEKFSRIPHPAESKFIDSFDGFGNFTAHRQIFGVEGSLCDFWVIELRSYSGEAQDIYDSYQRAMLEISWPQEFYINVMFVRTNRARIFEQTHIGVSYDDYGDVFALDYFNSKYLWRYPKELKSNDENLYFVYYLNTNVEVLPKYKC